MPKISKNNIKQKNKQTVKITINLDKKKRVTRKKKLTRVQQPISIVQNVRPMTQPFYDTNTNSLLTNLLTSLTAVASKPHTQTAQGSLAKSISTQTSQGSLANDDNLAQLTEATRQSNEQKRQTIKALKERQRERQEREQMIREDILSGLDRQRPSSNVVSGLLSDVPSRRQLNQQQIDGILFVYTQYVSHPTRMKKAYENLVKYLNENPRYQGNEPQLLRLFDDLNNQIVRRSDPNRTPTPPQSPPRDSLTPSVPFYEGSHPYRRDTELFTQGGGARADDTPPPMLDERNITFRKK